MTEDNLEWLLLNTPDDIKQNALKLLDTVREVEKLKKEIEHSRMEAMEVVFGIKEDGKLKYSNETSRKIAQDRLLNEDVIFIQKWNNLQLKEYELEGKKIELEYHKNKFSAYKAIALIQGGK